MQKTETNSYFCLPFIVTGKILISIAQKWHCWEI